MARLTLNGGWQQRQLLEEVDGGSSLVQRATQGGRGRVLRNPPSVHLTWRARGRAPWVHQEGLWEPRKRNPRSFDVAMWPLFASAGGSAASTGEGMSSGRGPICDV